MTYLLTCLLITYLLTYLLTYYLLIYLLTYSLTHSMEHSPSTEPKKFSASQEIPRILWNANVHYHIHKCPLLVPILIQLDPVHNFTSHFLEIHLIIIIPFTAGSPKWSLYFRFPHRNLAYASPLPIRATRPANLTLLEFITRKILCEVYISI